MTVASKRPSRENVNLGVGCVVLFLLPFATVGAVTAVMAVQRAAARNWTEALFFALFAITFGGVGFGGITAALAGRRKLKEQAALEASHPESPWLWRSDWASGRIVDSSRATMFTAWVFAAFWNLVSLPGAFFGVRAAVQEGNHVALLALLFPLVGIGLLVWAVRSTLRYRKYGVSRLELSTIPGVVGRTLTGMVRAPAGMQPDAGFQVTLSCVRRVTTGGEDRSTSESVLWQEERRVMGEASRTAAAMETHIPVAFRLPADAQACDDTNSSNRVLWRLRLSATVPGVDYESQFEVPVFRTSASDQPLSAEEEQITQDPLAGAGYQQPADSRIVVTSNRRGTEVLFPAARTPGAATSLTFFLLLWLGCIALQMHVRAPLVFPIVTGLFGVLILIGVLDLWLQVSRVTADAGTLTWAAGYLSPGRERTLHGSEIADVIASIGMQAGPTVYYDVAVVRKNGKKIRVGRSVRDKREAEWLSPRRRREVPARHDRLHVLARCVDVDEELARSGWRHRQLRVRAGASFVSHLEWLVSVRRAENALIRTAPPAVYVPGVLATGDGIGKVYLCLSAVGILFMGAHPRRAPNRRDTGQLRRAGQRSVPPILNRLGAGVDLNCFTAATGARGESCENQAGGGVSLHGVIPGARGCLYACFTARPQ